MKDTVMLIAFYNQKALGVRYLAEALKKNGYKVVAVFFKDFNSISPSKVSEKELQLLVELINKTEPSFIGLSVMSSLYLESVYLVNDTIKKYFNLPVVWGGVYATLFPDHALEYADYVIRGEGEEAIGELFDTLREGEDPSQMANLAYKDSSGQIVVNDVRPIVDVDELGFPSIGDLDFYSINADKIAVGDPQMGGFTYELTASRGCPYKCSYCSSINLRRIYKGKGKYMRFRSVDSVLAELNQAKKALPNLKVIHFWDEIFSNEPGWVEEFSQRYAQEIGIPFRVWGHPLMVNHRIISNLVEAGLYQIVVGIQSGSPRIRKEVFQRNESQEEIINCSRVLAECKVPKVIYDFMIHHPFESLEELKETYYLCLELEPPFELQIHGLHFLPGTDIVQMALDAGYYTYEEMNAKMYGSLEEQFNSWYWDVSSSDNIDELTCWTSMIFLTQFPALRPILKKLESNLQNNRGLKNIYRLHLIMNRMLRLRNLGQKAKLVLKP
ncbi:Radical SAM, alpha/beta horseshoe [Syntrophomonas zehnderi OL-4]|uniref:Radical SAM, alpha/beta horseshoe n=1 Tax=Syntrophomonas zehnderi OL-4 TaxID=690567 RepID=A0A0E3W3T6_9FIRM|nr:radical SAM protein [Syntrophomonas zehnderi]CFY03979.1 Radical SAM, alpha/beta horseshoe [Syntrophomonas zehnderi OL-4]